MAAFQLLTGLGFLLDGRAQLALVMTGMCQSPDLSGPIDETKCLSLNQICSALRTAQGRGQFHLFQLAFGNTGAFGYYAAWCMVGWVLILLFVPETKDLTLEQLDARFSISSKTHARFALRQCMFVIRHYVLQRKHAKRPVMELPPQEAVYGEGKADRPRKISFDKEDRMLTPASL
ncbi:MAG: hypothetical protein Q9216_005692 [Gyalolechia sp. 2 TL-2023]